MSAQPHETPAFQNAVEYTVAVTFKVAGGARRGTAERKAMRIAERLANTAARAAGVVEVAAVAGHADDGKLLSPRRVCFAAANSGQGTYAEPDKLDRYLDPERREAVGCANSHRVGLPGDRWNCHCVYCRPDEHLTARELTAASPRWMATRTRCTSSRTRPEQTLMSGVEGTVEAAGRPPARAPPPGGSANDADGRKRDGGPDREPGPPRTKLSPSDFEAWTPVVRG